MVIPNGNSEEADLLWMERKKDEKIMKIGIADLYIPHLTTFLAHFRDVLHATGPKKSHLPLKSDLLWAGLAG